MSGLLLDTHIWLWYVSEHPDLPDPLREAVESSIGDCWFSPVSIWELGVLAARGRVRLQQDLRSWVRGATEHPWLREAPITREVALTVHELDVSHRDPADHFLAATALVYDLTLVTTDRRLTELEWLPTLSWDLSPPPKRGRGARRSASSRP